jgi:cytochrome c biogenesis protein
MASPSVARSIRRQPAPKRARLFPVAFDIRRPFDSLWSVFSSVRTAIVLISALIVLSLIGVIVAQAPAEVVSSPQDYAAWVASNAQAQYGQFTNLFNWLQFYTIFTSWYFKALIVLLAINILVGGMLNRAPDIWRKFRHPQLRRADGFYVNSPVRAGVTLTTADGTTAGSVARLTGFFRKRGLRVDKAPGSSDDATYLYVHKNGWATLSTFMFHSSLIGIMLCAVLTGWSGFGQNSMAQQILPRPVYNYFQNLAGMSYDQPLPDGTEGVVYPQGTSHNIIYRAQDFVATFDPKRGTPTDFYTDLQVYQDGKLVAQQRIRVNSPLTYQGITFHQASYMLYTSVQIRDAQGQVLFSGPIPLLDQQTTAPDPNTGNVTQTNIAYNVPLANYNGEYMNVEAVAAGNGQWVVGMKGFDAANTQIFQGAMLPGQTCIDSNNSLSAIQPYGCKMSNGYWLSVNTVQLGTVLLITKDSGSPLLWPILFLLVMSLWITFAFPHRRYWVRVAGDQVQMAALKEHFVNLQRDLDSFARALGNVPLRPAAAEMPAPGARKDKGRDDKTRGEKARREKTRVPAQA